jgi:hypothetical protein
MMLRHRVALNCGAALVSMAAIASCSGLTASHEIPEDVCGIGLPAESYQPLLPGGEKLTARHSTPATGGIDCRVYAESSVPLQIRAEFDSDETYIDQSRGSDHIEDARIVEGDYQTRVWPKFAKALVMCEYGGIQRPMNITVFAYHPSDRQKTEDALADFIQPLAVQLSAFCEEPPSPQSD